MLGTILAHTIELVTSAAVASIQLKYAAHQMQQAAENSKRQMNAEHAARVAREDASRKQKEAEKLARIQAQQAIEAAAAQKEAAWKRFYQAPSICSNNPIDNATFTSCANEHIRARKRFEDQYQKQDRLIIE